MPIIEKPRELTLRLEDRCKDVEEAACLVAFLGDGATIRFSHTLVFWTEGKEELPAAESFDNVAEIVHARLKEHDDKMRAKHRALMEKQTPQSRGFPDPEKIRQSLIYGPVRINTPPRKP